jgi:uncharacterized membrane protein YkoI
MRKRIIIAGAAAVVLVGAAGGVAVATGALGGDDKVTGPQAERAVAAALAATGGGTAYSIERDGDDGAVWEIEVAKANGTSVEVRLDANLKVMSTETDDFDDDDDGDDSDDDGNDGERVTGPEANRVAAAAVDAAGGGTALSVERDIEYGSTWEVEVLKSDGTTVEVLLDDKLDMVAIGAPEAEDIDD